MRRIFIAHPVHAAAAAAAAAEPCMMKHRLAVYRKTLSSIHAWDHLAYCNTATRPSPVDPRRQIPEDGAGWACTHTGTKGCSRRVVNASRFESILDRCPLCCEEAWGSKLRRRGQHVMDLPTRPLSPAPRADRVCAKLHAVSKTSTVTDVCAYVSTSWGHFLQFFTFQPRLKREITILNQWWLLLGGGYLLFFFLVWMPHSGLMSLHPFKFLILIIPYTAVVVTCWGSWTALFFLFCFFPSKESPMGDDVILSFDCLFLWSIGGGRRWSVGLRICYRGSLWKSRWIPFQSHLFLF